MANDLIKIKDFPILDNPEDVNLEDRVVATHTDGSSRQTVGITVGALAEKANSDAGSSPMIPRNLYGTDIPSSSIGNNKDLYFRVQDLGNGPVITGSYIKLNDAWVSFQVTDDNWKKFLTGQGFDLISYDLESVKAHAFENNTEINNVILPVCTHFYEYAFKSSSITSLSIPSIKYIGDHALEDLKYLSGVIDLSSLEEIGVNGFAGPGTPYTSIFPEYTITGDFSHLKTVRENGFYQNYADFFIGSSNGEKVLNLPVCETIEYQGFGAYYSVFSKQFDKILLPKIKTIGDRAFRYITRNLPSGYIEVHIGPDCTYIGSAIFYDMTSSMFQQLDLYCEAIEPPTLANRLWNTYTQLNPHRIYVPESSVTAYKEANVWSLYSDVIEAIPEEE